jgi:hypothetical protein
MLATGVMVLLLATGLGGHNGQALDVALEACSQASRTSGECLSVTGSLGTQGLTLEATSTRAGQPGSTSTIPGNSVFSSPRIPAPPRYPVLGSRECSIILAGLCRGQSAPKNPPASSTRVVRAPTPPQSVRDLAAFSPLPPGIVMEPGSWTLPRVPTNIYSSAGPQTQTGVLLGWPIEVRFSPQAFHWSYGDGAGSTESDSGGSWGSNQFQATSSSHIYKAPGSYTVTLRVDYAVSYRFGQGAYVSLPGSVSQSGPPATLQVLRVNSILVEEGCPAGALTEGRCE